MSCEVRFLYLIKEDKKMKNKVLKKTLAAALALTLVGGAMPTAIGGNGLTKPAIVADAAGIGDIFNWGDILDGEQYQGFFASADGEIYRIYPDDQDEIGIIDRDYENSMVAICLPSHYGDYIYVNVPEERKDEYPTGIKIASGEGTDTSPYQLELVYEGEPIEEYDTTVGVGTKWMIGDLINTDAYFRVPVQNEIINPFDAGYICGYEYQTVQLYRKKLSIPYDHGFVIDHDPNTNEPKFVNSYCFPDSTLGCYAYNGVYDSNIDWTDDIVFPGNAEYIKGIKVTGGEGTQENPFTIAPIGDYQLENGTYKQTLITPNRAHYTRFVFVKPKSEIEGKSKAVFTATNKNGVTKKFETSTYYTGMTSNSEYFTPADENSVMFIVTVKAKETEDDSEPLKDLTCTLDFE